MPTYDRRTKQLLLWLLPTGGELFVYIYASILTIALSNFGFISKRFLFLPDDFRLSAAILRAFNVILEKILGVSLTATFTTAIFWAVVGLLIYAFIWVGRNFSSELSNSLAATNFIYPSKTDPKKELRSFVSRGLFQVAVACVLIFYTITFITALLPYWALNYQLIIADWPRGTPIWNGLVSLVSQVIACHGFTILLRLLFLRKRLFRGAEYLSD